MEASPPKVIQYFNGEKQNLIPLFQRPYTWKETNWQTLWQDVMVQYDQDDNSSHFMGPSSQFRLAVFLSVLANI